MQQLERLKAANDAANRVMRACHDFDKCTPESLAAVTEYLASLPDSLMQRVCSATEGVLTRTKFLPTVAEFRECADAIQVRDDKFKPTRATGYRYFSDETPEEKAIEAGKGDADQRKAFIERMKQRYPIARGVDREASERARAGVTDEFIASLLDSHDKGMVELAAERAAKAKLRERLA